ncbi:MAG: SDR family oxidoreductase [Pseudomonadota bacterium]
MVVLVTGAGGGIGAEISRCLAERGARLVLMDLSHESLDSLASDLPGNVKPETDTLDIRDEVAVEAAVRRVADKHGRLDGLINAAGIYRVAPITELESDDFLDTISVNLTGPFFLTRAAARVMSEGESGRILHMASVSSHVANPEYGAYATSKAALSQMIRVVARELAPKGITVNAIGQAVTDTPLTRELLSDDGKRAQVLSQIPMGRLCKPEDILAAALLLMAPGGAFITGQTIFVDGGRTLV